MEIFCFVAIKFCQCILILVAYLLPEIAVFGLYF